MLTYTLYNAAAYRHIREHRLYLQSRLRQLRDAGPEDRPVPADRSIPPFPTQAIVLKTAWWPVAHDGLTALPVWDPQRNPVRRGGNDYTTWQRIVAVDPSPVGRAAESTPIEFAGGSFPDAHRIDLRHFYHVVGGPVSGWRAAAARLAIVWHAIGAQAIHPSTSCR